MREHDAKRPPGAVANRRAENERHEGLGSRQQGPREAARKDERAAQEVLRPGPPPAPGIEEDYGARSGEVPSEEPGNRRQAGRDRPT
jgi:hypothetical protein